VNPHAGEPGRDVAPRPLAVVREKGEWNVLLQQLGDETLGPGNELFSPVDYAVHVNQKAMPPHSRS
jgi:hypothetical protein